MTAPELERLREKMTVLKRVRQRQRRLASGSFFVAGVGFGTALYLLRARFATLDAPSQRVAFVSLVALMVAVFWLGARAELEVGRSDEQLRDLEEAVQALLRR